jgi:hypothetical protein
MKPSTKVAVVAAGYAGSFVLALASATAQSYVWPADQASGGMAAFGDFILFVGIFGCLALMPTGVAIYWIVAAIRRSPDSSGG